MSITELEQRLGAALPTTTYAERAAWLCAEGLIRRANVNNEHASAATGTEQILMMGFTAQDMAAAHAYLHAIELMRAKQ
jgi:hypothetical protein